ncbi:ATP-binding cassette domain-containing protein [Serpentinicella alkaliphila]|uniref:ABC-type lipoprotein export system ATPase subunit n=1 Tax=Serpentinicella alkaliphila TaxID=1734049 RepID=A0A4R2TAT2_9FIRM|nr:ATP-binding cassette domain-containing protein [Serpentinicella alkaliphila]QUH24791.1 ATP-binding cassette domain-containing protein [Serpentinicella alkaliphila]TCP98981.1 ABC-type lipoprotein export system ATPase subunit [Serpentinicella alkaliphila]
MLNKLEIIAGYDKKGIKESVESVVFERGQIYTIVGKTGSGKTLLMEDIECLNDGEGITKRTILIDGEKPGDSFYVGYRSRLIAHLSQNMNYILDMPVLEFLNLRNQLHTSKEFNVNPIKTLETANLLSGEEIQPQQLLTKLSGGQSRALMITDVALNSSAPVILIDEVENAGIDRIKAMSLLIKHEKIVLVATHDPLLALYGNKRIVLSNGGMSKIIERSSEEEAILEQLIAVNDKMEKMRLQIRNGESLKGVNDLVL